MRAGHPLEGIAHKETLGQMWDILGEDLQRLIVEKDCIWSTARFNVKDNGKWIGSCLAKGIHKQSASGNAGFACNLEFFNPTSNGETLGTETQQKNLQQFGDTFLLGMSQQWFAGVLHHGDYIYFDLYDCYGCYGIPIAIVETRKHAKYPHWHGVCKATTQMLKTNYTFWSKSSSVVNYSPSFSIRHFCL